MNSTIYVGPMFAGKTTELVNAFNLDSTSGFDCVYAKFIIGKQKRSMLRVVDSHDGIVKHNNKEMLGYLVSSVDQLQTLLSDKIHVFIDEIQFLHETEIERLFDLLSNNKVYIAGLDTDYKMQPFVSTGIAMCLADNVVKRTATCHYCQKPARYTFRDSDSDLRLDADRGQYKPVCKACHENKSNHNKAYTDACAKLCRQYCTVPGFVYVMYANGGTEFEIGIQGPNMITAKEIDGFKINVVKAERPVMGCKRINPI